MSNTGKKIEQVEGIIPSMVQIPSTFSFSKIPMHLQKAVINDMETEFGIGWSIKKGKKKCLKIARDADATKQRREKKYFSSKG